MSADTCDLADAGLRAQSFISPAKANIVEFNALVTTYDSLYGCVKLDGPQVGSTLSWYCATSDGTIDTGRPSPCNVPVVEPSCQAPYDIKTATGSTISVLGCLKDPGNATFYCYSRGQKSTCTPGVSEASTGGQQVAAGSNKSSSHTGAIVGGIIGGIVGLAALFLIYKYQQNRRSNKRSSSKEGLQTQNNQPPMSVSGSQKPLSEVVTIASPFANGPTTGNSSPLGSPIGSPMSSPQSTPLKPNGSRLSGSFMFTAPKRASIGLEDVLPSITRSPSATSLPMEGSSSMISSRRSSQQPEEESDENSVRPYRTYVNFDSNRSIKSSSSFSSLRSLNSRGLESNNGSGSDNIIVQNYVISLLNFEGKVPPKRQGTAEIVNKIIQGHQAPTSIEEACSEWQYVYHLFFHLTEGGFQLASGIYKGSNEQDQLNNNVFLSLARKSMYISEDFNINDTCFGTADKPNQLAFLSLLSDLVVKSLFIPLANPVFFPLYTKTIPKQYKQNLKSKSRNDYSYLDLQLLFGHLLECATSLPIVTTKSPLGAHIFQVQSNLAKQIESLYKSFNLPIPTTETIEEIVSDSTVSFLKMKTAFPTLSVFSPKVDIDVDTNTMSSLNTHPERPEGPPRLISLFSVWPGLCEKKLDTVDAPCKVWTLGSQ